MEPALSVLARNMRAVLPYREALSELTDGQLAELARVCRAEIRDPADAFRQTFRLPLCSTEFARLCRMTADSGAGLIRLLPEQTPSEKPSNRRTAYLRNAYSDRAFAAFSGDIDRLSAQYLPSFSAACEEVYYDRCSYCILPLQSSEDGLLASFSRMIAKYDLKIARICDVVLQDGESTMRYALLKRGLELNIPDDGFFQATFVLPKDASCGAFLAACEETGAAVDRITTTPLHYTNDISALTVCFRIGRESTAPLLLFLRSVLESYTPDGLFSLIR